MFAQARRYPIFFGQLLPSGDLCVFANCVRRHKRAGRPALRFFEVYLPWQADLVTWTQKNPNIETLLLLYKYDWERPATSTRLFEGNRHFLLIFASLRNRFIFF